MSTALIILELISVSHKSGGLSFHGKSRALNRTEIPAIHAPRGNRDGNPSGCRNSCQKPPRIRPHYEALSQEHLLDRQIEENGGISTLADNREATPANSKPSLSS